MTHEGGDSIPLLWVVIAILALALLSGPVVAGALSLGDPIYAYDRAEVTTTETGIEWADEPTDHPLLTFSDQLGCTRLIGEARTCAFEAYLLERGFVPSGHYTTNTSSPSLVVDAGTPFRYVQLDGHVYEPTSEVNESVTNVAGRYGVDFTLTPADPDDVLLFLSIPAEDDDLSSVIAETAETGTTTVRGGVTVPDTTIAVEDGSYYRVYEVSVDESPRIESLLATLLTYGAPLLGIGLVFILVRRMTGSPGPSHR